MLASSVVVAFKKMCLCFLRWWNVRSFTWKTDCVLGVCRSTSLGETITFSFYSYIILRNSMKNRLTLLIHRVGQLNQYLFSPVGFAEGNEREVYCGLGLETIFYKLISPQPWAYDIAKITWISKSSSKTQHFLKSFSSLLNVEGNRQSKSTQYCYSIDFFPVQHNQNAALFRLQLCVVVKHGNK